MSRGRAAVVALLGAESTGKTTLAGEIAAAYRAGGATVAVVAEYLREFCDRAGRTPRRSEQDGIAAEQTKRIDDAAARIGSAGIVIADTTALQIAVYTRMVFGNSGLDAAGDAAQRRCDITLLTGCDLPWQADGLQREGPHVREPVDRLLREALARCHAPYTGIGGSGPARLEAALAALAAHGDARLALRPPRRA